MRIFLLLIIVSIFSFVPELVQAQAEGDIKLVGNRIEDFRLSVSTRASENDSTQGYNQYLQSSTSGYSMTQVGGSVRKSISFYLKNNGNDSIYITKLTVRDSETLETVSTSTDASLLGTLLPGESKELSVTLRSDINLFMSGSIYIRAKRLFSSPGIMMSLRYLLSHWIKQKSLLKQENMQLFMQL